MSNKVVYLSIHIKLEKFTKLPLLTENPINQTSLYIGKVNKGSVKKNKKNKMTFKNLSTQILRSLGIFGRRQSYDKSDRKDTQIFILHTELIQVMILDIFSFLFILDWSIHMDSIIIFQDLCLHKSKIESLKTFLGHRKFASNYLTTWNLM